MRNRRFLSISALVGGLVIGMAAAPAGASTYGRFGAGYSTGGDFNVRLEDTGATVGLALDPGFRLDAALGWSLPADFGVEAEFAILLNELQEPSALWRSAAAGRVASIPLFLNLLWRPSFGRISPFAGAGAGGAVSILHMEEKSRTLPSGIQTMAGNEEGIALAFAYHGFAGIGIAISEGWGLRLAYDYQVVSKPTWDFNVNMNTKGHAGDIVSHSLMLGIEFRK